MDDIARQVTISSGCEGLDEILAGGLPPAHLYLVQGGPGCGKTTLGLQFLLTGLANGEKVLYVSLSQSARELQQIAGSHGWSLDGVRIEELASGEDSSDDDQTIFYASDLRLDKTRRKIEAAIRESAPSRIVYDSLLEIRQLSNDTNRFRREIISFKRVLEEMQVTAMMIDVTSDMGGDRELESLAHGIIRMSKNAPPYGSARRRLEVRKMRGVNHASGEHDFEIRPSNGIVAFPRVRPSAHTEVLGDELIKSGVEALDEMLGGGMEPGTSTLVIGQSGTGKSTMASLYAEAALRRGEAVSLFLFEERVETFFRRSEGLGMDLRQFHREGLLELFDFDPAEVSPGEFAQTVKRSIEVNQARVVLIDSFTGYLNALPDNSEGVRQMHTLLKFLARKGVLTILIVAQTGLLGVTPESPVDVSFLGDTVIYLQMRVAGTVVKRTITVVKKRHGPHDLDVRELAILENRGLIVSPIASAGDEDSA